MKHLIKKKMMRDRRRRPHPRAPLGDRGASRLAIHRTLQQIYAQVIDDVRGVTLCSASSLDMKKAGALRRRQGGAISGAKAVGGEIARRAAPRVSGGRVRPRRLSLPRTGEGARRRGARSRTESSREQGDKMKYDIVPFVEADGLNLSDRVVKINRCATVVKGGRRFSFSALVVVGDGSGVVGYGFGKAKEVPMAVEKAVKDAKKKLMRIPLVARTVPHPVKGYYGATRVYIARPRRAPASPPVRRCARSSRWPASTTSSPRRTVRPIPVNVVRATMDGLLRLRTQAQVEALRGVTL